jgi:hypothetical protein
MTVKSVTICCEDAYEASHMLDWFKYYSTCEDIREHIRGRFKHADLGPEATAELELIQSFLYPREEA